MGMEEKWHDIAETYADVNQMFGDIVKVTPSSKVVGDMALMMVAQNLSRDDVENRKLMWLSLKVLLICSEEI